jgi:hypothetical protein
MKYSILIEAAGTKETGSEYPQCQEMMEGYDYNANNSIYRLNECRNKRPFFTPNLDGLKMHSKSKLTDVISCAMLGGMGLFVSNKLKIILERFNLVDHLFFQASLYYKKKQYNDYYWLHLISDYRKFVDFSKSKFVIGQKGINPDKLNFKTYAEYNQFEREVDEFGLLRSKNVYLLDKFDCTIDMFMISQFNQNIYVSERLVSCLMEENVTGIEILGDTQLMKVCQA